MKKLFINSGQNGYIEEFEGALKLKDNDSLQIDLQELSVDYLKENRVAVIISNGLPKEWYYTFKGMKIVTLTFDNNEKYDGLADIVIDCQSDHDVAKYFTGPDYSITKNKDFAFNEVANLIVKLEWDSDFFGYPVAFLSCRELTESIIHRSEQFIKNNKIRLIEYLSNCHDRRSVLLAEKYGYNFVDIRLKFEKRISESYQVDLPEGVTFGLAEERHIAELEKQSSDLYLDSRYFFDEHFDRDKINEFYSNWLSKAVNGQFDDECFCLFQNDKPIGFCTVKYKHGDSASIRLFGLSRDFQRT